MSQLQLDATAGVLRLSGILDYQTGTSLRAQGRQLLQSYPDKKLSVDCAAVEKSSSVGIALLLAFMRDAVEFGLKLNIVNLPPEMQKIAQVSELDTILVSAEHKEE